jgi:FtsP/CotA-like multicopper oxidase with cupredoxin domain
MITTLAIPKLMYVPNNDKFHIDVYESPIRFSPNAALSGNESNVPNFSSKGYLQSNPNNIVSGNNLPFFQITRGSHIELSFHNKTNYFSNFHFHGLNIPPATDGVSQKLACGPNTQIGRTIDISFDVTNNSFVGWYHPHVLFVTGKIAYGGLYGVFEVIDDFSKRLDKYFTYGKNSAMLIYWDIDLNSDGSFLNTYVNNKNYRSQYGVINNQVCIEWSQKGPPTSKTNTYQYVMKQKMVSQSNLYKLTILNGTVSFRSVYLGVCDTENTIQSFYYVQCDDGLRDPIELTSLQIAPGERVTIVFDLNNFSDNIANVFFYDYDLTVDDDTKQKTICGFNPLPSSYNLNIFLEVHLKKDISSSFSLKEYNHKVREIVFGNNIPFGKGDNYLYHLNRDYFYNLPTFHRNTPLRQIVFNMPIAPTKGITEFVNMQPRLYADMWNDYEYAIWKTTRNPHYLPTCLFNITPTLPYENYEYLSNDTFVVDIINEQGTIVSHKTIKFPITKVPLNILQWTNMVNDLYSNTHIGLPNYMYLSDILSYEWTDYLYNVGLKVNGKDIFIKTVMIYNKNNSSEYTVKLSGKMALLLLFGKSAGSIISGDTKMIMGENPYTVRQTRLTVSTYLFYLMMIISIIFFVLWYRTKKNSSLSTKWGISTFVLILFTILFYYHLIYRYTRSSNSNIQQIISCGGDVKGMKIPLNSTTQYTSLEITPNSSYTGMPNGYANENMFSFCVKENSSERWLFINADTDNSHPLHFHMTSGFADINSELNSQSMSNPECNYNLTYSKDIYSVGVMTTLLFYIKFSNFNFVTGNKIPYLGYSFHCHFLLHHDMAMMSQFGVYGDKEELFNDMISYKEQLSIV